MNRQTSRVLDLIQGISELKETREDFWSQAVAWIAFDLDEQGNEEAGKRIADMLGAMFRELPDKIRR